MNQSPIDIVAQHLRSAPVNIEQAIRDLGIVLKKGADLPAGIAGHVKKVNEGHYEIASSKTDHYYRQRFTLAHELGHFILHRGLLGDGVDDDTKYRSTEVGDFYNTAIEDVHERQANAFAAKILMPEKVLRQYVEDNANPELADMAKYFQVSRSAMRWRLKNKDLYDKVQDNE